MTRLEAICVAHNAAASVAERQGITVTGIHDRDHQLGPGEGCDFRVDVLGADGEVLALG